MRHRLLSESRNIVIKVGTSVLTHGGRFDAGMVRRLAEPIARFLTPSRFVGRHCVSIVSSGAIGAGMTLLKMKKRPRAMAELQGAAAVGQRYLMQCYEKAFSHRGFSTAQILLTWADLADRERYLNAKHTLTKIQRWGLVPVVNENDTVATEEIRFGDNDRLSALLAILLEADALVILSDTDGLYAGTGSAGARARIPVVSRLDGRIFSHVRDEKKAFTVGGMRSKLRAVKMGVDAGIPVVLADGREPGILTKIFEGRDVGTFFAPHAGALRSRADWKWHYDRHVGARKP